MYYEINVSKLEKEAYYSDKKAYKHLFATAPRSCTSETELRRTLQEIIEKFPEPEYSIMVNYNPEQMSGVSLSKILGFDPTHKNRLMEMFNISNIKQEIKDCRNDECVILMNHFSINRPKYTEEETLDDLPGADWEEMEECIGIPMEINQYDDLIVDPYGIVD